MRKLLALSIMFAIVTLCSAVTLTFKSANTTVTTTPESLYEYLSRGYVLQNEATAILDMYQGNYSITKNTVSVTPTTYTSITYTGTTVRVLTGSSDKTAVRNALAKVKIGSVIETAHSPILQGIVRNFDGYTITVGAWYNMTTTSAITPSPTTGTAFYINDWKAQTPLKYKKLTGTTASATGTAINIAHGLTGEKIISITGKVKTATNIGYPANTTSPSGVGFSLGHDATNVIVSIAADGTSITGKAIDVYLTYEE